MISKKVLLMVICFIVLLAAIGAYSYVEISGLTNKVDSLQDTVSSLESERDSLRRNNTALESQIEKLQDNITHLVEMMQEMVSLLDSIKNDCSHWNSTNIVFYYRSAIQNVVNGTLRMNLTFTWNDEKLYITAKINDDDYSGGDYLGVMYGGAKMLFACNLTYDETDIVAIQPNGFMAQLKLCPPHPSFYHTCIFEPNVGYTFNVSLPIREDDLIYLCYFDQNSSDGVYEWFQYKIS